MSTALVTSKSILAPRWADDRSWGWQLDLGWAQSPPLEFVFAHLEIALVWSSCLPGEHDHFN